MDTLITIIVSSMATGYVIEAVSSFFSSDRWIKRLLTLPLAYLSAWGMGLTGLTLAVAGPAVSFLTLALLLLLSRPVTIKTVNRR